MQFLALSPGEWTVNVKQDTNDYRKPPFDKPRALYIFVRLFAGGSRTEKRKFGGRRLSSVVHTTDHIQSKPAKGGGGGLTRGLITEITKQDIIVLIKIRSAFIGF